MEGRGREELAEKSKKDLFSSLQNLLELCSVLLWLMPYLAEYEDLVFLILKFFFLYLSLPLNAL